MSKKTTLPYNAALMEAITDMVFIVSVNDDSSLTSEFFNQAVFERTHLTKENLGKTFYENHSPEVARILNEHYGKVLEQKKRVVYEDAFTRPTGEKNYSKSTLTPLFDEAGICTHIIGLVKDLTEERRAGLESEQALEYLKESRSRYRSLFENNTDAIFSLDLNRQILTGNPTVEKTTDCLLNDLIGNGLLEYIPKNDEELVETYFQLALDGVSQDFRTKFLGEGDKQIPVLVHFSPIEVKGEVVGVYATLKDMTVLDKMVSQYIEIENRFRIIAENAHDVIVLMDHKGEAIYVSPSSKRVYGLDPEEYLAK
ncbi:MAG TPA: PAS domain S-box protein, partial [Planococcus sp. (in: firmicutes)]|nr:PAS domain S-box protein [Planococcus sp. (in: firmicutes)]